MLRRVKENRCLITTIYRRQKNWIGHILRGDGLLRDVMEGRMMGKRPRGRPRARVIDELMEGSCVKMKRRAEGREEWRKWGPRTCLWGRILMMMMRGSACLFLFLFPESIRFDTNIVTF